MRRIDVAAMFMSLWLLATMVIDVLTPKELTAYVIGTAIAPAVIALAILYYKRVPTFDFAVTFAALWMASWMALEIVDEPATHRASLHPAKKADNLALFKVMCEQRRDHHVSRGRKSC